MAGDRKQQPQMTVLGPHAKTQHNEALIGQQPQQKCQELSKH